MGNCRQWTTLTAHTPNLTNIQHSQAKGNRREIADHICMSVQVAAMSARLSAS
jgi:hypothetical protein